VKACQEAPAKPELLESWTSRLTLPAPPLVSLVVRAAVTTGVPVLPAVASGLPVSAIVPGAGAVVSRVIGSLAVAETLPALSRNRT
jgi:hypothetical protein